MSVSLIEGLHHTLREVTQSLSGESVTLHHRTDENISTEISDAVVAINPPIGVNIGSGKAQSSGSIRLSEEWLSAAETSNTVTCRGELWHVLAVGKPFAGWFRCEIANHDEQHSNIFDINDNQAVWAENVA